MSVIAGFGYNAPDGDVTTFPRVAKGLDVDVNWSLAHEGVTVRGSAFRNASVRDIIEYTPRGHIKVTKERAVLDAVSTGAASATPILATDALKLSHTHTGTGAPTLMDVEEAEGRMESAREECLSFSPSVWVQDGAIAGTRATEVRTRVVTDSPVFALAARNLLHSTPLYAPEVFPRTLTVFVATKAHASTAAGAPTAATPKGGPYILVDVDPATARGVVLGVGNVSLQSLQTAIATAASQLMARGGYRHVKGGDSNPNIREARRDGVLAWYLRDGHYYAPETEAHPDLLLLPGDVLANTAGGADGKYTMVIGGDSLAASAAAAQRLYAAHHSVWHAAGGVSSLWGAAVVPASAQAASPKALPLVRGAVVTQGNAVLPLAGPKAVPAPSRVVVVGGAAGDLSGAAAVDRIKTVANLTDAQAEKLTARISAIPVTAVATAADAAKALGL